MAAKGPELPHATRSRPNWGDFTPVAMFSFSLGLQRRNPAGKIRFLRHATKNYKLRSRNDAIRQQTNNRGFSHSGKMPWKNLENSNCSYFEMMCHRIHVEQKHYHFD